ncbi:MAG: prepilin-type N-terminal cleavage/methylation domain-containing protein [Tepidanaerobacteraceae bacterium]|nr:prepilin-type N-terminal cleavage/methylation domain-containing protein [Tepidanaerobacteraceae bacterium]
MLHIVENTKTQKGFTLIELILSIGLLSLILTTTFTLYSAEKKTYERENQRLFVQQNTRQALLWLSTSIKQAKNVQVKSERRIETITSYGDVISYYFEKGVLYRNKNNVSNPIAQISFLRFSQPKNKGFVEIIISTEANDSDMEIRTKATPFGYWIN